MKHEKFLPPTSVLFFKSIISYQQGMFFLKSINPYLQTKTCDTIKLNDSANVNKNKRTCHVRIRQLCKLVINAPTWNFSYSILQEKTKLIYSQIKTG